MKEAKLTYKEIEELQYVLDQYMRTLPKPHENWERLKYKLIGMRAQLEYFKFKGV